MWKPLAPIPSLATLVLALSLTACASLNTVESDVSTYSQWPAERKASSFVFERLPSQQARPQEQDQLEAAARGALEAAGFKEASDPKSAEVTVQVGARINRLDRSPYDDPFWWHGGLFYSRYYGRSPFWGPNFAYYRDTPRYDREVAVLIRDRQSSQPLYEARATNDGLSGGSDALIQAMFQAAMKDFPQTGINPRRVVVQLPPG